MSVSAIDSCSDYLGLDGGKREETREQISYCQISFPSWGKWSLYVGHAVGHAAVACPLLRASAGPLPCQAATASCTGGTPGGTPGHSALLPSVPQVDFLE